MSGSLGHLNILLSMDSREFTDHLYRATKDVKKFTQQSQSEFQRIQNSIDHLCDVGKRFNTAFDFAKLTAGATAFVRVADGYTNLSNRLSLVTQSAQGTQQALDSVYRISMITSQSMDAVGKVYQNFAQNAQQLGISQTQVASLTETISKAVAVSGASASAAEAALTQFGQALGSGVLRGDEFNSVIEQTPALARAIATGLGVTVGQLRALANDGKLTADVLVGALEKAKSSVDSQIATQSLTLSNAFTQVNNAFTKWVGNVNQNMGVTKGLAEAISWVANNLGSVLNVVGPLGVAFAGVRLAQFSSAMAKNSLEAINNARVTRDQAQALMVATEAQRRKTTEELKATQAYIASLQAQLNLTRVESTRAMLSRELEAQIKRETVLLNEQTAATARLAAAKKTASVFSGALSLVGGPIGALTLGLTAATSWFFSYQQAAEEARQKSLAFADELPHLIENLKTLDSVSLSAMRAKAENSIEEQKIALTKLQQKYAEVTQEVKRYETQRTQVFRDDSGFEIEIDNTRKLEKARREQAILSKELADAEAKLAETQKNTAEITEQYNITTESERKELLSRLGFQTLDLANETSMLSQAILASGGASGKTVGLYSTLYAKLGELDSGARNAADGFYILAQARREALLSGQEFKPPAPDEKTQKFIDNIKQNNQIKQAFKNKDKKAWIDGNINRELSALGLTPDKGGYAEAQQELNTKYQSEWEDFNKPKGHRGGGGGKSKTKKGEKEKSGTSVDYQKQLTEQLTQMQSNLAQLQTDAKDISLFGQPSQYQEINKLTQDIANNAEKYKHYGVEGVEKLKAMANQLNAAQQEVVIGQFKFGQNEKLDAMEFELSLSGKSRQEQELLQYNHQLDLEAAKLKIGMSKENAANLDIEIAKLKERYAQLQKERQLQQADPVAGIKAGIAQFGDEAQNVMGNVANITGNALNGMSNALTDFVTTGKADFRGLAQSIIKDISAMIVKMMIFKAIQAGMNAMGFGGFAEGGAVGGYAHGGLVGFDGGGFTGVGGKYQPAGIVHKGEYVLTKEATSRIGVDYLNYLNYGNRRGFASGGGVAVPRLPQSHFQPGTRSPNVSVKVINNGQPMEAEISTKQQGDQMEITVALMKQIARQEASNAIQQNFRAGGAFA